jgi:putative addiction module killer protein
MTLDVRECVRYDGTNPFRSWFDGLHADAAAKVAAALARLAAGNVGNVKRIGAIAEYRIDWGPGYRIYFGRDGEALIILLGGGTKKRQQNDIANAEAMWAEYRRRKRKD